MINWDLQYEPANLPSSSNRNNNLYQFSLFSNNATDFVVSQIKPS